METDGDGVGDGCLENAEQGYIKEYPHLLDKAEGIKYLTHAET